MSNQTFLNTTRIHAMQALICFAITFFYPILGQAQTVNLDKTVDNSTPQSGEPVTYTITLGCSSLVGDCEGAILTDILPEGMQADQLNPIIIPSSGGPTPISPSYDPVTRRITWDFTVLPENGLPAGVSASVEYTALIDAGTLTDGYALINMAVLESDNAGTATADAPVTVSAAPDWTITKTNTSGTIYHDQPVTYEVQVCSGGTVGNLNLDNVVITDDLPPGADFVSATLGGSWDNNDPGAVTWTLGTLTVDSGCTTVEVTVVYPYADQTNNNTGLATSIPKNNVATLEADPVGEPQLVLTDNANDPLEPPFFGMGITKEAQDNGILPLGAVNSFLLSPTNSSTAQVDSFILSDDIPDQFLLDTLAISNFMGAIDTLFIYAELNHSDTLFLWQTVPNPSVDDEFAVVDSPGFVVGTDYISNVTLDFGSVPAGFSGDLRLTVAPAYGAANMPTATDNMGVMMSLATPYTNTATLNGRQSIGGAAIPTQAASDDMCIVPAVARIDPQKSQAVNYVDQPAGSNTEGNPYFQNSRVQYTVRIENDGDDDVTIGVTSAQAFQDLIDPIGSDLLPADVTYITDSWYITDNSSSITLDTVGDTNPVFEELTDYNSTGRKLLRWNFNGNMQPGEYLEITFDVIVNQVAEGTVVTNDFCVSTTNNDFICDEEDCGESETMTADLDNFFTPATVNEMCCKSTMFTVQDSTAVLFTDKMVLSSGPYAPQETDLVNLGLANDTVFYQATFGNHITANIELPNPTGYDLLPREVVYVPGSLALAFDDTGNNFTADGSNPVFTVTEDYQGTGRTMLKWEFTGEFPIDSRVDYTFKTTIPAGEGGQVDNITYIDTDYPNTDCVNFTTDIADVNDNGDNTDVICSSGAPTSITIQDVTSLNARKLVRGANDTTYLELPDIASTNPDDSVHWKFYIQNPGNQTLTDVVIIDIFPFPGDVGVQLNDSPRESEWTPYLVEAIAAPAGITISYSQSTNPCRDEISPVNATPSCVNDWTTTPPADLSLVKAIKIELDNPLLAGELFEVEMEMFSPPNGPPSGSIAWNSIARNANEIPAQEPNKVGVELIYPDLALQKTLAPGQSSNIEVDENITFRLRVINQGAFDAFDIEVTDYLPAGLTLNDPDWVSVNDSTATYQLDSLLAGQSQNIDITLFAELASIGDTLTNFSEISSLTQRNGLPFNDLDSTPDGLRNNDGTPTDNELDNGSNDQDDHDLQTLTVARCEIVDINVTYNCNDNGTPYSIDDDSYTIRVNPTGTSLGTTYSITGDYTAAGLSYGSSHLLPGTYTPNDPPVTITITDDRSSCSADNFEIPIPSCSLDCPTHTICLPVQLTRRK